MRFLLKSAFMIFVLLLIVPFFAPVLLGNKAGRNQAILPNSSDIGGAVSAARGTIDYMSGMCNERPDVCDDGAGLLGFLGNRARQGAEIVYLYLGEHFSDAPAEAPSTEVPAPADEKAARLTDDPDTTVTERMTPPDPAATDMIRTSAITPDQQLKAPPSTVEPAQIYGLPKNAPIPTPRPR